MRVWYTPEIHNGLEETGHTIKAIDGEKYSSGHYIKITRKYIKTYRTSVHCYGFIRKSSVAELILMGYIS